MDEGAGQAPRILKGKKMNNLEIAIKAIEVFAAKHPRPANINQKQAAQMLGVSEATICKWVRAGRIRLNNAGMISITEIDRLLEAA